MSEGVTGRFHRHLVFFIFGMLDECSINADLGAHICMNDQETESRLESRMWTITGGPETISI
jgi:hypothetical protein